MHTFLQFQYNYYLNLYSNILNTLNLKQQQKKNAPKTLYQLIILLSKTIHYPTLK